MNTPIPVAWPLVLLVAFILGIGVYVLGGEQQRREDHWLIGFVMRENRYLHTCVGHLYDADGLLMPEIAPEPEPQPRWYRRAWDRLKGAQAPTVMGARVVEVEDGPITETVPTEAERQAAAEADDFTPDPAPATNPIVMPEPVGIPTQPDLKQAAQVSPLAALSDEEWAAQQEADIQAWRQEQEAKWGAVS